MKKISWFIALFMMAVGALRAETISQTKTFNGQPNYSSALTFNQFDNHGGTWTLNSIYVSVVLNTAAGASLGIDNDGQTPASGIASFGSSGSITNSTVDLIKVGGFQPFLGAISSTSSTNMSLLADDGDGTTYSTSGADYGVLITDATSASDSAYLNSLVFSQYIGLGTYSIYYKVSQEINTSSFGGAQIQIDPTTAGGSMTIIYDYTAPIPEPATAPMIGILVLVGAWFRRRFLA